MRHCFAVISKLRVFSGTSHSGPPGPIEQMHQEIIIFYSKLLKHAVRNPTRPTWADRLPRGLFFPDSFLGFGKMKRGDILLNDGLHMHGIMIVQKRGVSSSTLLMYLHSHIAKNHPRTSSQERVAFLVGQRLVVTHWPVGRS
jgi:hypothetical protein